MCWQFLVVPLLKAQNLQDQLQTSQLAASRRTASVALLRSSIQPTRSRIQSGRQDTVRSARTLLNLGYRFNDEVHARRAAVARKDSDRGLVEISPRKVDQVH